MTTGKRNKSAYLSSTILVVIFFAIGVLLGCDGGDSEGSATTENDVVLDVPFVRNYGDTCVASSYAMVLQYLEPEANIGELISIIGRPPFDDNNQFDQWIMNNYNLLVFHYPERTIDDVISCIDQGYPAIVHQQDSLGLAEGHMRVVIGYNLENNYFIIHDPSNRGAFYRETFSVFETLWELITNIESVPANQIFLLVPIGESPPLD